MKKFKRVTVKVKRKMKTKRAACSTPAETAAVLPAGCERINKSFWRRRTQPWELAHWQKFKGRSVEEIRKSHMDGSARLLTGFGFKQDEFDGKSVLDVGCGPTGRLMWFTGATLYAIEPLAKAYQKLEWGIFAEYKRLWARPIEEYAEEFNDKFDVIMSLNCLDHCYDLQRALMNIFAYLKPGGPFFLSVDCNKLCAPDYTHPLDITHRELHNRLRQAGFSVKKVTVGLEGNVGRTEECWGGGTAWNWWLEKPDGKAS